MEEHYTVDEAAYQLNLKVDYLLEKMLFSDKAHPVLKPCVLLSEPTSMRLVHRNVIIYLKKTGIEHAVRSFNDPPADPVEAARLRRIKAVWPEDVPEHWEYPQVMRRGLFELTFYPEHMDMTEARESGRVQLFREKAVCAPSANVAVDLIMNSWHSMTDAEISRARDRIRQDVGDMVILTQDGLHYLVDAPVSVSLSDIRVTERMLADYAASKGITRRVAKIIGKRRLPLVGSREVVPVRLIPLITGGPLGQETLAGILSNRLRANGFPHDTACAPQHRDNGIRAYYLGDQGEPVEMRPVEWGDVCDDMAVTEKLLRKDEEVNGVEDSMYSAWRLKTTEILPPGVFLWRSDFETLWKACIACALPYAREPEDYRVINFGAYLPPEYRRLAFEGFEYLLERFEPPIQPEAPKSPNASGPEPPPSPTPNESPAPCAPSNTEPVPSGNPEAGKVVNRGPLKRGGAPKGFLREAFEHVYLDCRSNNPMVLQKGFQQAFLKHLQNLAGDGRRKVGVCEYVSERIELVQPTNNVECVKTHECKIPGRKYQESRWYGHGAIARVLSELRSEYPITDESKLSES